MAKASKEAYEDVGEHSDRLGMLATSSSLAIAFIPRTLRDFTDHGQRHSEAIVERLREFFKIVSEYCGSSINARERFLSYAAAFLHDIGNIKGRTGHAKRSAAIVKDYAGKYINGLEKDEIKLVCKIVMAHSRSAGSSDPLRGMDKLLLLDKDQIKLRLLAALFRLADASDTTSRRAPPIIYELFGLNRVNRKSSKRRKTARKHWLAHQNITGLNYDPEKKVIWLMIERLDKAMISLCNLCDELNTVAVVLKRDMPKPFPCLKIRLIWSKDNRDNREFARRFDAVAFRCKVLERNPRISISRQCPVLRSR